MAREIDHVVGAVNAIVKTSMEKLAAIWDECGYNNTNVQQRCEAVQMHVQSLFDEMVEEEEENKNIVIRKIEGYLKEMAELSKDLNMEIPVAGYENLPLCNVERTLRYKVEEYCKIKESLLHRLAELKSKKDLLCNALGMQPQADFGDELPSEQQLDKFEVYIKEKNDEKERLMEVYRESKSAIISIMSELNVMPLSEFEKLVCNEGTTFRPTKENMIALRELHQRLEQELDERKTEVIELREKLTQLWDRLCENHSYRDEFLGGHPGHSGDTLKALKDELKRCEELKRQNIKRFIEEIRKDLTYWWDKCLISKEERLQFRPQLSECLSEDLELHELEVQKFKSYYEQNIEIFELAKERQELWDKMLALEDRANDPNRLFLNRGGQLLLEEKERKNIQKKLPKVERDLMKLTTLYEKQHGEPFKIYGVPISAMIENQWTSHKENKEQEKKAKKFAKDRMLEMESRLGSQSRGSKRKNVPGTPVHSSHKLGKMTGNDRTAAPENKPRSKQQTAVSRKIFAEVESNSDTSADSHLTTYTHFQEHLEVLNQEVTCRSSVVPGRCLRERNTPARTPSKIPSKVLLPTSNMKKTPQARVTPIKPPRKNIAGLESSSKRHQMALRTARGTPSSPMYQRGTTTPQLTTPRGWLPIII